MDKNMTLEKRIAAELYSYQGKMSVFVDDLHGHTVEIGADEEFETASTIKAYILAALYLQASRGKASLEEKITYKPEHFDAAVAERQLRQQQPAVRPQRRQARRQQKLRPQTIPIFLM